MKKKTLFLFVFVAKAIYALYICKKGNYKLKPFENINEFATDAFMLAKFFIIAIAKNIYKSLFKDTFS